MVTFQQIRKQIGGDHCGTQRRASPEQLDYLARLILDCEGRAGFRWDYRHPESFTAYRAKTMIENLKRIAA